MSSKTFGQAAAGLRQVDPDIVEVMREVIIGQTDESLNAQFGLCYNTWCKIRTGQPVRRSLAERLESRVREADQIAFSARWAANGNEVPPADKTMSDQVRFERCIARELAGDVDF